MDFSRATRKGSKVTEMRAFFPMHFHCAMPSFFFHQQPLPGCYQLVIVTFTLPGWHDKSLMIAFQHGTFNTKQKVIINSVIIVFCSLACQIGEVLCPVSGNCISNSQICDNNTDCAITEIDENFLTCGRFLFFLFCFSSVTINCTGLSGHPVQACLLKINEGYNTESFCFTAPSCQHIPQAIQCMDHASVMFHVFSIFHIRLPSGYPDCFSL